VTREQIDEVRQRLLYRQRQKEVARAMGIDVRDIRAIARQLRQDLATRSAETEEARTRVLRDWGLWRERGTATT
jgi:hypothetical protein